MITLGLTGSVAMGKSEAARMLKRFGLPVFDADAAVHRLTGPAGEAVPAILQAFPDAGDEAHGVDRRKLGARVFGDQAALAQLEAILHPLVFRARQDFLERARAQGARVAVLDIPLLYETGGAGAVDAVAVVSAPHEAQKSRALARPGMTEEKFAAILARQMPDSAKTARADYVLDSGSGKRKMLMDIKAMLRDLLKKDAG